MNKVFVVGGSTYYASFLTDVELTDKLSEADIVLFTGGEDVTPSVYGCRKHLRTYCNLERDTREKEIFKKIRPDQFVLGICRGSQFLCAMNGGILIQDCTGHAIGRTHAITNGTVEYQITSTHHQMQFPFYLDKKDYDLLYWAEFIGDRHSGDKIDISLMDGKEPEIVLYHKQGFPNCLAVQGHPEMIPGSPVAKMIDEFIKNHINDNK